MNHLACWKDLLSVADVVAEAMAGGVRLHGCKQLSAIVSLKAISLMPQLIWRGKGNGATIKKPAGYPSSYIVVYVIANAVRWVLILILCRSKWLCKGEEFHCHS